MKEITLKINADNKLSHINPEIYGHFSEHLGNCIYDGIYVGEDSEIPNIRGVRKDVIEAFKAIHMPVLRWPGGCFADEYHWRDGIGDKSARPSTINTNWGGVTETNAFGTHDFFDLCEEIGCEPYLAGNLGSGTIKELMDWIEYITFDGKSSLADERRKNGREKPWKLKYLGIGNENWGGGGTMKPEYYANEYRRYQCFCKDLGENRLYKIACGPNAADYNWTENVVKNLDGYMAKGISLHYYTLPTGEWEHKGDAVDFSDEEYYSTISRALFMEELIERHTDIIRRYHKDMALIVDEWGCWYDVEKGTNPGFLYQQNTMRDAIVAAINLNIFNEHADSVKMANLAQAVNVLQALILTKGGQMILTPTYHVFDMFKAHQGGELVFSEFDENPECEASAGITGGEGMPKVPLLSKSVSVKDGRMLVTLANCSLSEDAEVTLDIAGFDSTIDAGAGSLKASARILSSESIRDHNTFTAPETVVISETPVTAGKNTITIIVPAHSVVSLSVE